jgi:aminoglycoside 6'-N-acetyltransferase I
MRSALWPHCDETEHVAEMQSFVEQPQRFAQFLAASDDGRSLGFAEVSLRVDYVNGCESSPVGYLEGIWVEPQDRRRGVARALVRAAVDWSAMQGCSELASDTPLHNLPSQKMHLRLGFSEAERIVHYVLPIKPRSAA